MAKIKDSIIDSQNQAPNGFDDSEASEPCELCGGTGEVTSGEFDDIITKKCQCRDTSDMDDDS